MTTGQLSQPSTPDAAAATGRAVAADPPRATGVWWPRILPVPATAYLGRLHGRVARLVDVPRPELAVDPGWVAAHSLEWDIAHLALGAGPLADAVTSQRVVEVLEACRARAVPSVVTVLDLDAPVGRRGSGSAADVLRAAGHLVNRVVTLTEATAGAVADRTGCSATVIPHGPVLSATERRAARMRRRRARLLADSDGPALVVALGVPVEDVDIDAIAAVAATRPGAQPTRVLVDPADIAALDAALGDSKVEAVAVDAGDVQGVTAWMADAAVVVLPMRRAPHLWVPELAADIGLPVVAADVGDLGAQQQVRTVPVVNGAVDVGALLDALDRPMPSRLIATECQRERAAHALYAGYDRLYERVCLGASLRG